MQRDVELMRDQFEAWRRCELIDVTAKNRNLRGVPTGKPEISKHLVDLHTTAHDCYLALR
jgi:hypothetical protein